MNKEKLEKELVDRGIVYPIFPLEETVSTNDVAKSVEFDPFACAFVIAERQSGGRGRMGRSFFSPPGGIYMSMVFRQKKRYKYPVTLLAALAVCNAVEKICGLRPEIKWPNDILLGGRKICGILTEGVQEGKRKARIIVGVGLNVNTREFPEELSGIAGSLATCLGRDFDEDAAIAELALALTDLLGKPVKDAPGQYRNDCSTLGKWVEFQLEGKGYEGQAEGIGEDGALLIRLANGEMLPLRWGEVSVRPAQETIR